MSGMLRYSNFKLMLLPLIRCLDLLCRLYALNTRNTTQSREPGKQGTTDVDIPVLPEAPLTLVVDATEQKDQLTT